MKTKYKFIYFEKGISQGKEFWAIKNNKTTTTLGFIRYYKPWRQYVFESMRDSVFNDTCLADIQHFMGQLKEDKSGG